MLGIFIRTKQQICSLESAKSEIERLASFILKYYSDEIGKGDFQHGESAVDVAIRLMTRHIQPQNHKEV